MWLKVGLISFRFNSKNHTITKHYANWLIEALRNYEARTGSLPELVLSAGFTCPDTAELAVLEREFNDKPVSIAVEMLDPADSPLTGPRHIKARGQFYVVGGGKTARIEPRQQFSSTGNVAEELAEKVVAGLAPNGSRRFSVKSRHIGWIECGEINLLHCHKDGVRVRYEALERRFFEAATSLDIILNPQHTRMSRLHLLRKKAEALSAGKLLQAPPGRRWPIYAGTANWDCARQHSSQSSLQCVMRDGQRLPPDSILKTENYILSVFRVDMPQRVG